MKSSPSVYDIPFSSHHTKGIGGGSTGRFRFRFLLHMNFINTRTVPNINSTFDSRFHPGCNSTTDSTYNPGINLGSVLDADATKNLYPLQC